jgi:xanthine dehydrogenase accessory factor
MNKEREIWRFAAEKLSRNESVMLLLVARSSGSSPGRQGFKVIVAEDELIGSIGGGVMEMRLVEQAKSKIKNCEIIPNFEIIEQIHRKNSPDSSGMICSGKQSIILYKLNKGNLTTIRQIISASENHQSKILQITENNFRVLETQTEDFEFGFHSKNEKEFVFEEKLGLKNKLFIVGAGHCALALSELMSKLDFYITLFDDRAGLNTFTENRFVDEKQIIEDYEKIDNFIRSGARHFVVVMTLGYKSDEIVIKKLIDKNFKYFGVLGSRAKMATLLKRLGNEGFSKEKLSEIHTPIGLRINSRTPEEIAISIAAEIIAVKNGGSKN